MAYGTLRAAGRNGLVWSETAFVTSSDAAYNLNFDNVGVLISDNYNGRWSGFTVRCLAK